MAIKIKGVRKNFRDRENLPVVASDQEGYIYAVLLDFFGDPAEVAPYSVVRIHHHAFSDNCEHDHGDPELVDDFATRQEAQRWVEANYDVQPQWTRVKDHEHILAWESLLHGLHQAESAATNGVIDVQAEAPIITAEPAEA